MTRNYTVSKDKDTGLWYVHKVGFNYIPVFGSFRKTKTEAEKIIRQMIGIPTRDRQGG